MTVEAAGRRRPRSLRRRLLRLVTLSTVLTWGLASVLGYRQALIDVQELMDGQMAETARLLLAQARHSNNQLTDLPAEMASVRGNRPRRGELALEFRIYRTDGAVLMRSAHAPMRAPDAGLGYADIEEAGTVWRSLTLESADGTLRAQVAHPARSRNKEAFEIASNAALPSALLLPLMLALIYVSVRRGLKPLDDLAAHVGSRSPENLAALPSDAVPREAQSLVKALNRLLGRLTAALDNERRFTADAAHELRTPLAALKVQAQIALAAKEPQQQRHALAQVLVGADRATRLVEQLLRLARLDPIFRLPEPRQLDLAAVARESTEEAQSGAAAAERTLRSVAPVAPVMVSGDADLLGVAVRNLIDNALRYTPPGTVVTVSTDVDHGDPVLAVTDDGRGVAAEELHCLAERFYRGREVAVEGSGLGLAIVHRIAELHGAHLEFENLEGGGFAARLRWGELPAVPD